MNLIERIERQRRRRLKYLLSKDELFLDQRIEAIQIQRELMSNADWKNVCSAAGISVATAWRIVTRKCNPSMHVLKAVEAQLEAFRNKEVYYK